MWASLSPTHQCCVSVGRVRRWHVPFVPTAVQQCRQVLADDVQNARSLDCSLRIWELALHCLHYKSEACLQPFEGVLHHSSCARQVIVENSLACATCGICLRLHQVWHKGNAWSHSMMGGTRVPSIRASRRWKPSLSTVSENFERAYTWAL